VAESGAGDIGGEVPVNLALVGVDGCLPGVEFGVEGVEGVMRRSRHWRVRAASSIFVG